MLARRPMAEPPPIQRTSEDRHYENEHGEEVLDRAFRPASECADSQDIGKNEVWRGRPDESKANPGEHVAMVLQRKLSRPPFAVDH